MRFVKAGAITLALACATIIGAGAAHADQTVTVTGRLLGCAFEGVVDLDVAALLKVGPGGTITVSDDVYAELEAASCLD
ncbi:hypothetical protein OHA40_07935 [Nocardia sp. NBC_00508]|uniref:hypothetical protein n=1 Tax=Nocardia sp. NBC_00508 TaxID=2975992 RepID=UPI002E81ED68|nr:hypothetical protein [Nocardia sp. NBC_00508]WUD68038.1 hypothetical protein OHA40_07935 [Nocardia sp. NBC_00508]